MKKFFSGGSTGGSGKGMIGRLVPELLEKMQAGDEMTPEEKKKRESQGMKKGGYVTAADGCAKKGKTKGRMV